MSPVREPLALFPLRSVLFPAGRLSLKVFEARYVDLVSSCLREKEPFGVVCLLQGSEVRQAGQPTRFESMGVLAHVDVVDVISPGLLKVHCNGGARFTWASVREGEDGLWQASGVSTLAEDGVFEPGERFADAVQALERAYAALGQRGDVELPTERHFDNAGWVANRWCELLPVPVALKQRLMELDNPLVRLELVSDVLTRTGIMN